MIDYFKGIYGINLLLRIHGSALYKGSLVGILSVFVYLAIDLQWNSSTGSRNVDEEDLDHPYGVGVLVSSVTFLIIFRANYGYQRYWEACGAVHHFMSKWLDATMHCAVFHLQSKHYDGARPPSFFDHDELNKLNLTRARKRHEAKNDEKKEHRLKSVYDCEKERSTENMIARSVSDAAASYNVPSYNNFNVAGAHFNNDDAVSVGSVNSGLFPKHIFKRQDSPLPPSVLDGQWDIIPPTPDIASSSMLQRTKLNSKYFPSTQHPNENFAYRPNGHTPPLFLQELAHLSSLACAVALSTLRNDIEGSESPLDMYTPGSPWPVSDPDKLPRHIRNEFQHRFHIFTIIRHWLGLDRIPAWRSYYNAARPLLIIGGVSNAEIQFLQMARGPHAKAQLALAWLKEFIIREHLEGSLGEVHSAIISRLVQFMSDGMIFYHQARKIMYIPFPFPHAQLSAFYSAVMVFAVPFLMDQYTNHLWIGSVLSFLTVTCLVGLHEVARELENPFRNVPNEIPLCTLQAMYNEALVTMFSGYNPDSFWDPEQYQGALEAMAMGKVYKQAKKPHGDMKNTWTTKDGVLDMDPLPESIPDATSQSTSPCSNAENDATKPVADSAEIDSVADTAGKAEEKRKVTFAAKMTETNSEVAKELRDVLAKQALELEQLSCLLDDDGDENEKDEVAIELSTS